MPNLKLHEANLYEALEAAKADVEDKQLGAMDRLLLATAEAVLALYEDRMEQYTRDLEAGEYNDE